jgi:voltage-gated potassium channel Kch
VDTDVYYAVLATSLLTILINAFLVRAVPRWIGELRLSRAAVPPVTAAPSGPRVLLCGYGRVGSVIGEALDTFRVPYTVLETDPDIVKGLHARGVPAIFGDAGRRNVLDAAGAASASVVVLALPAVERTYLAIRHLRALDARLPILARAHGEEERDRLLEAGASEVIQPELEAAATLTRHSLERAGVAHEQVLAYMSRLRDLVDYARAEDATAGDALPRMRDVTIAGGDVADLSLRDARVRERFGVSVLMVQHADGTIVTHPHAETVLRPGDRVRVFGLPEQIERFAAACAAPAPAQ